MIGLHFGFEVETFGSAHAYSCSPSGDGNSLVVQSLGLGFPSQGFSSKPIEAQRPHNTPSAKDKFPIFLVKATFSSPEYPMRLTPKFFICRKVTGAIVTAWDEFNLRSDLIPACGFS